MLKLAGPEGRCGGSGGWSCIRRQQSFARGRAYVTPLMSHHHLLSDETPAAPVAGCRFPFMSVEMIMLQGGRRLKRGGSATLPFDRCVEERRITVGVFDAQRRKRLKVQDFFVKFWQKTFGGLVKQLHEGRRSKTLTGTS